MAQEGECNPSWANQSSSLKRYMWILRERISWHFEHCMPAYLYCLVSLPGLRLMKDMVYRRMCPVETEVRLSARLHYQKMTKLRTDCELGQAWTPAWKTNEASSLSGQGILSQGTSRTFQEADSDMRLGCKMFIELNTFERKREEAELGKGAMRTDYRHESHCWSNEMLQSKACLQREKRPVSHITSLMHWQGATTNC